MLTTFVLLTSLLSFLLPTADGTTPIVATEEVPIDKAEVLYKEIGLEEAMAAEVFLAAYHRMEQEAPATVLAIADMSKPSTEKRLFVFDLEHKALLMRTWVAHGQNTGELMAEHFSNRHGSHQTSLGLYRVGTEITSPKHGPALLLEGLDKGLNDQARAREVIIHGADYVSADFIREHGRLGRSWGCPAVGRDDMPRVIELLADGGLLYVHGS